VERGSETLGFQGQGGGGNFTGGGRTARGTPSGGGTGTCRTWGRAMPAPLGGGIDLRVSWAPWDEGALGGGGLKTGSGGAFGGGDF